MSNHAGFVGTIPHFYDIGLGPVIFVDYAEAMARRVAALPPGRVLETAAGTGIVSRALRNTLPANSSLTVTDLNPPMLEIARQKFAAGEAVSFEAADATRLPFADSSFDIVVCQFGVMFFPDKELGYREVKRVLAPGGRYFFSVWLSHRDNPYARLAQDVCDRFFPDQPPQFFRVPFSYPFDAIQAGVLSAGFEDLRVDVLPLSKTVADIDLFARGMIFGNPLLDQIRERGGVDPETVCAALASAYRQTFGAGPGVMPLRAMILSARSPG